MNFRVRTPVLGTDVIRTDSLEEKGFWHKKETGNEEYLQDCRRLGVLTRQGFYQSYFISQFH